MLKLEAETSSPDFWRDHRHASEVSTRIAGLKEEVASWDVLSSEIAELGEFFSLAGDDTAALADVEQKTAELERKATKAEAALFLSGKYDAGNAILSVYGGAGGEDAEDWAAILVRMYQKYIESKGWSITELHRHTNDHDGIKNATYEVRGKFAYGYLKGERGVHRLVRISPFDANKRRHTSFAMVEIMPEMIDEAELEIRPEDIEYNFARSSGPGGQNVNKRETAVRITHTPTNISVEIQTERSQAQNKERALQLLRSKLYQIRQTSRLRELDEIKGGKVAIEWGSQIRSYVFHPYQMVKDHRTGVETAQVDKVLEGELEEFVQAELKL
ncbi:MAG: peptide chain release factor 2 [Candidatus Ryanbacteria bacterium RIFCSPHIGHO2_01_FULL_48_27]|uniref:Peptide chain release factor 2 n=1 Tax=Candidatus Ryanbacteria bacterium RIFCSPHIGHO2_01_FULL_48_27 TaxID=1802115 RepID=A0A1G2G5K7_9BACT|nr:MAG: peptide chain release factor 2 [Candidatus Ryanbacteria bacterium RIFCSPHIGHO2_01_FULL_48_27]